MAIVYLITNTRSNKVYVGWTSKTIEQRWNQHVKNAIKNKDNTKFHNAIRKYDLSVWTKEILHETQTSSEAKLLEIQYIEKLNSYFKGYNSTKGGDGNNGIVMSIESNIARSKALKGIPKSPETIAKFKQRTSTTEENLKRSIAHKGMKKPWVKWSEEQITKRAMSRRSITENQYNEIHRLKNTGLLLKDISKVLEIDYNIVKKWSRKKWELF